MKNKNLELLGKMSATLIHEINNPVTAISAKINLLEKNIDQKSKDEILKDIKVISNNLSRVSSIINTVKNLSRIHDDIEFSVFEFSDILQAIPEEIKKEMTERKVKFETIKKEDVLYYADLNEIMQVVCNLFINSLDEIKEEGFIKIHTHSCEKFSYIDIKDSGPGISKEQLEHLFEPFYTTKAKGKGTGLGLSVSKAIMQRNKGDLEYLKDEPQTTFRLIIQKVELDE